MKVPGLPLDVTIVPRHCVLGTWGAAAHCDLHREAIDVPVDVGMHPLRPAGNLLTAIRPNMSSTSLEDTAGGGEGGGASQVGDLSLALKAGRFREVYFVGVNVEHVVVPTAIATKGILPEAEVFVVPEACVLLQPEGSLASSAAATARTAAAQLRTGAISRAGGVEAPMDHLALRQKPGYIPAAVSSSAERAGVRMVPISAMHWDAVPRTLRKMTPPVLLPVAPPSPGLAVNEQHGAGFDAFHWDSYAPFGWVTCRINVLKGTPALGRPGTQHWVIRPCWDGEDMERAVAAALKALVRRAKGKAGRSDHPATGAPSSPEAALGSQEQGKKPHQRRPPLLFTGSKGGLAADSVRLPGVLGQATLSTAASFGVFADTTLSHALYAEGHDGLLSSVKEEPADWSPLHPLTGRAGGPSAPPLMVATSDGGGSISPQARVQLQESKTQSSMASSGAEFARSDAVIHESSLLAARGTKFESDWTRALSFNARSPSVHSRRTSRRRGGARDVSEPEAPTTRGSPESPVSISLGAHAAGSNEARSPRHLNLGAAYAFVVAFGTAKDVGNLFLRYGWSASCDLPQRPMGYAPLHLAVLRQDPIMVATLLHAGADPNARSSARRETALLMACRAGHMPLMAQLLSHPALDLPEAALLPDDSLGLTPLSWAALHVNADMVSALAACVPANTDKPHLSIRGALRSSASRVAEPTPLMLAMAAVDGPLGEGDTPPWAEDEGGSEIVRPGGGMCDGAFLPDTTVTEGLMSSGEGSGGVALSSLGIVSPGGHRSSMFGTAASAGLPPGVPALMLAPSDAGVPNASSLQGAFGAQGYARLTWDAVVAAAALPSTSSLPPSAAARRRFLGWAHETAEMLLRMESTVNNGEARLRMLKAIDLRGWTAMHFGAAGGVLGGLNLELLPRRSLRRLPASLGAMPHKATDPRSGGSTVALSSVAAPASRRAHTQPGTDAPASFSTFAFSPLHLAAWAGHMSTVAKLVLPWAESTPNPLRYQTRPNAPTPVRGFTCLDLAWSRNHLGVCRMLLRQGAVLAQLAGTRAADQLLFRLALNGDGIAGDAMIGNDSMRVRVTSALFEIVRRLRTPGASTFTFTSGAAGAVQFMFRVEVNPTSEQVRRPHLRLVSGRDSHTGRGTARSGRVPVVADPTTLVRGGHSKWHSEVQLATARSDYSGDSSDSGVVSEAPSRRGSGRGGGVKGGDISSHPALLVCAVCADRCWHCSPQMLRHAHGMLRDADGTNSHAFRYAAVTPVGFVSNAVCQCPKDTCRALSASNQREAEGYRFKPNPIDVRGVSADDVFRQDPGLEALVTVIAKNSHDVWARSKIEGGWRFGEKKDGTLKTHPLLKPFEKLTASEQNGDLEPTLQSFKVVFELGYRIRKRDSRRAATSGAAARRTSSGGLPGVVAANRIRSASGSRHGSRRRPGSGRVLSEQSAAKTGTPAASLRSKSPGNTRALSPPEGGGIASGKGASRQKPQIKHGTSDSVVGLADEIDALLREPRPFPGVEEGDAFDEAIASSEGWTVEAVPESSLGSSTVFPTDADKSPVRLQPGTGAPTSPDGDAVASPSAGSEGGGSQGGSKLGAGDAGSDFEESDARVELESDSDLEHDEDGTYTPQPIDTSSVDVPRRLGDQLKELLSKNSHEMWAEDSMKRGIIYAPTPEGGAAVVEGGGQEAATTIETSPLLVPYRYLTEAEKDSNRETALEFIRVILKQGYVIELEVADGDIDVSKLSYRITDDEMRAMATRTGELAAFKRGMYTSMLLAAAQRGVRGLIAPLVNVTPSGRDAPHDGPSINAVDGWHRTALYSAVQRGHKGTASALLTLGANVDVPDCNGLTPLALAAMMGNAPMVEMLLDNGAGITAKDTLSLTPLHYASFLGHVELAQVLGRKLVIMGGGGDRGKRLLDRVGQVKEEQALIVHSSTTANNKGHSQDGLKRNMRSLLSWRGQVRSVNEQLAARQAAHSLAARVKYRNGGGPLSPGGGVGSTAATPTRNTAASIVLSPGGGPNVGAGGVWAGSPSSPPPGRMGSLMETLAAAGKLKQSDGRGSAFSTSSGALRSMLSPPARLEVCDVSDQLISTWGALMGALMRAAGGGQEVRGMGVEGPVGGGVSGGSSSSLRRRDTAWSSVTANTAGGGAGGGQRTNSDSTGAGASHRTMDGGNGSFSNRTGIALPLLTEDRGGGVDAKGGEPFPNRPVRGGSVGGGRPGLSGHSALRGMPPKAPGSGKNLRKLAGRAKSETTMDPVPRVVEQEVQDGTRTLPGSGTPVVEDSINTNESMPEAEMTHSTDNLTDGAAPGNAIDGGGVASAGGASTASRRRGGILRTTAARRKRGSEASVEGVSTGEGGVAPEERGGGSSRSADSREPSLQAGVRSGPSTYAPTVPTTQGGGLSGIVRGMQDPSTGVYALSGGGTVGDAKPPPAAYKRKRRGLKIAVGSAGGGMGTSVRVFKSGSGGGLAPPTVVRRKCRAQWMGSPHVTLHRTAIPNSTAFTTLSPLTLAVFARQLAVASILIKLGADPTFVDGSGASPYDRALEQHSLALRVHASFLQARTEVAEDGKAIVVDARGQRVNLGDAGGGASDTGGRLSHSGLSAARSSLRLAAEDKQRDDARNKLIAGKSTRALRGRSGSATSGPGAGSAAASSRHLLAGSSSRSLLTDGSTRGRRDSFGPGEGVSARSDRSVRTLDFGTLDDTGDVGRRAVMQSPPRQAGCCARLFHCSCCSRKVGAIGTGRPPRSKGGSRGGHASLTRMDTARHVVANALAHSNSSGGNGNGIGNDARFNLSAGVRQAGLLGSGGVQGGGAYPPPNRSARTDGTRWSAADDDDDARSYVSTATWRPADRGANAVLGDRDISAAASELGGAGGDGLSPRGGDFDAEYGFNGIDEGGAGTPVRRPSRPGVPLSPSSLRWRLLREGLLRRVAEMHQAAETHPQLQGRALADVGEVVFGSASARQAEGLPVGPVLAEEERMAVANGWTLAQWYAEQDEITDLQPGAVPVRGGVGVLPYTPQTSPMGRLAGASAALTHKAAAGTGERNTLHKKAREATAAREEERAAAAAERRRERALQWAHGEVKCTSELVTKLNTNKRVQNKRRLFALTSLCKQVAVLVAAIVLFGVFTPVAVDYGSASVIDVSDMLNTLVCEPFKEAATSPEGWQAWFDENVLWIPPDTPSEAAPLLTPSAASRRLQTALGAAPPAIAERMKNTQLRGANGVFSSPERLEAFAQNARQQANALLSSGLAPRDLMASGGAGGSTIESLQASLWGGGALSQVAAGGLVSGITPGPTLPHMVALNDSSLRFDNTPAVVGTRSLVIGAIRLRRGTSPLRACQEDGLTGTRTDSIGGCSAEFQGDNLSPEDAYTFTNELNMQGLAFESPDDGGKRVLDTVRSAVASSTDDRSGFQRQIWDLNSKNVTARRLAAVGWRSVLLPYVNAAPNNGSSGVLGDSWTAPRTRWLSIDLSVYNPDTGVFAAVRLFTYFPMSGRALPIAVVRALPIFTQRFQPSFTFEIVVGIVVLLQSLLLLSQMSAVGSVSEYFRDGWNVMELGSTSLFIVVLVMDVINFISVNKLNINLADGTHFVNLWSTIEAVRTEVDVIAVVMLFVFVRFVKYLQLAPGAGPVLVAILLTFIHGTVLLYLGIMMGVIIAFGVSFHVAFASENINFSTVWRSILSLFGTSFAEEFQRIEQSEPRVLSTLFFVLFLIVAVLLVNVLIAIVSDQYPKEAHKAAQNWDALITHLMEQALSSSRALAAADAKWGARCGPCAVYLRRGVRTMCSPSRATRWVVGVCCCQSQVASEQEEEAEQGNALSAALGIASHDGPRGKAAGAQVLLALTRIVGEFHLELRMARAAGQLRHYVQSAWADVGPPEGASAGKLAEELGGGVFGGGSAAGTPSAASGRKGSHKGRKSRRGSRRPSRAAGSASIGHRSKSSFMGGSIGRDASDDDSSDGGHTIASHSTRQGAAGGHGRNRPHTSNRRGGTHKRTAHDEPHSGWGAGGHSDGNGSMAASDSTGDSSGDEQYDTLPPSAALQPVSARNGDGATVHGVAAHNSRAHSTLSSSAHPESMSVAASRVAPVALTVPYGMGDSAPSLAMPLPPQGTFVQGGNVTSASAQDVQQLQQKVDALTRLITQLASAQLHSASSGGSGSHGPHPPPRPHAPPRSEE